MHKELTVEDETVLLPPLPEKDRDTNSSNPKEKTISVRKEGLERFLNKVLTHEVLRESLVLRKFICQVSERRK